MPLYVSLQASGIIMVLEQQATKPPPPPGNVVQWITLLLLRNQLSQIGKHKELIMTVFVPESHSQLNFEKAM